MDRVSSSSPISNCSKYKLESDAKSSALASAIRNKGVALQIIDKKGYTRDPLSWTCETPQKYWEEPADSAKFYWQFKKKDEKGGVVSRKVSKLSNHRQHHQYIDQSNVNRKKDSRDGGSVEEQLETDLEDSDYAPTPTEANQPFTEDAIVQVPKLSLIPETNGATAWLKTSMLIDSSADMNLSAFIEDPFVVSCVNENQRCVAQCLNETDERPDSKDSSSENIVEIEQLILNEYKDDATKKKQRNTGLSSGLSSGVGIEDGMGCSYPLKQQTVTNKRDFSKNSKLRFPSKSSGNWIPHVKPLCEFLDFRFEEKAFNFSDQELEIVKKLDYVLACKFCYRGFNITMMVLMFLDVSLFIVVTTLYALKKLPPKIELIHLMFFDLVVMFVLFAINSCASKEVRIDGQYAVRSYFRIYWHLLRRKFDALFDKRYMFVDDWYGDDKYKFINAKLQEISQIEEEMDHEIDCDTDIA